MPTDSPRPIRLLRGEVTATGEEVLVEQPVRPGRTKARKQKQMSMVNVIAMQRLQMTVTETRVFWCLVGHVPSKSGTVAFVQINQIAEETGIHRVEVSKTMKALRDRRIITTVRQGQHHINANIVFTGSFDEWNDADVMEREPVWTRHGVDPVTGEVL
jgi:hypothetical protein